MTITEIINSIIAGGLLGMLGQGVRIVVGLKKMNDGNAVRAAGGETPQPFDSSRLIISIFIGFVAGAVGMLVKGNTIAGAGGQYSTEAIVTIIAIGYSGADFIEGIFKTYVDKFTPGGGKQAAQQSPEPPLTVPDEASGSQMVSQG